MTLAHRYKILYDFEICYHNNSKDLKRLDTWIHQQILNLPNLKRSLIRTFPAPVPSLVFCKHLIRTPWRNMGEFLFVCLDFLSHSRIFHSFGEVNTFGEGQPILTYARHLWPLSTEGSIACHTYCDTGHLFIMIISKGVWHFLCQSFGSWAVFTCLNDIRLSRLGFEHPTYRLRGERSNPLRHRRGFKKQKLIVI